MSGRICERVDFFSVNGMSVCLSFGGRNDGSNLNGNYVQQNYLSFNVLSFFRIIIKGERYGLINYAQDIYIFTGRVQNCF